MTAVPLFGYGLEWAEALRRRRLLLVLTLLGNLSLSAGALLAWTLAVVRPPPVVQLRPSDAAVCPQWAPSGDKTFTELEVVAWARELVDFALVRDSSTVVEDLRRLSSRLGPRLRTRMLGDDRALEAFLEVEDWAVKGTLGGFELVCGAEVFQVRSAPWYCYAIGEVRYGPILPSARAEDADDAPLVRYLYVRLAVAPGEPTLDNPFGLVAVDFGAQEFDSRRALDRLLVTEAPR